MTPWQLAWLLWAAASILRLLLFVGFGLGDDANELISLNWYMQHGLNLQDFMHYRFASMLSRSFAISLFPDEWREFAFILPVYLAAIGTHAATLFFAREVFGTRIAALTSLLFLVSPFETLCATANIPDYIHSCFGVLMVQALVLGYRRERKLWMAFAGLAFFLGLLNRMAMMLYLPPIGFAMIWTVWRARRAHRLGLVLTLWATFYLTIAALLPILCAVDYVYSGSAFRWFYFNSLGGHDVTAILDYILMVYPRYLFFKDDLGNSMFGLTAWPMVFGFILALVRLARRRDNKQAWFILGCVFFLLLIEFMPHQLTLKGYYSHSRIFRYLAQAVPAVYVVSAYFLDFLWPRTIGVFAWGKGVLATVVIWSALHIMPVRFALSDAAQDIRALLTFMRSSPLGKTETIHLDAWRYWIVASFMPKEFGIAWQADSYSGSEPETRRVYLEGIRSGYVVTGGAKLPWYSNPEWHLRLGGVDFAPDKRWKLVAEYPRPLTPWRDEPMRIWKVDPS